MASDGIVLGGDLYLVKNTGTRATPTWVTLTDVIDVSLDSLELTSGTVQTRSCSYKSKLPAKFEAPAFNVTWNYQEGNGDWDALRADFFAKTIREYAISTADLELTSGTHEGFRMFCFVESFPMDQPLEEVASQNIVLRAAYNVESGAVTEPTWDTAIVVS